MRYVSTVGLAVRMSCFPHGAVPFLREETEGRRSRFDGDDERF